MPRKSNTPAEFLAKVQSSAPDDCWPFTGAISSSGYGNFSLDWVQWGSHRLAYTLAYGPIPPGMEVCHSCDIRYAPGDISYRACCNPRHLWLGTFADNMADKLAKKRQAMGNRHGTKVHPNSVRRGQDIWTSVVTEEDVKTIWELFATGLFTKNAVARKLGVSKYVVGRILNGQTWKHVIP